MGKYILTLFATLIGSVCSFGQDSVPQKKFFQRIYEVVKKFSQVDTSYIEPQHYNFTAMLQNTNTYEVYSFEDANGQSVTFAPEPSVRIGPYFGWHWVFLGYTFDILHAGDKKNKQDWNLSLYSNQLGVDLFYRKVGNNYKIKEIELNGEPDMRKMRNIEFDGLSASIIGFNLYYIFNHKKFSYPAAYSQSTIQRKSAGSFLAGIGYTRHSISVEWDKLYNIVREASGTPISDSSTNSEQLFSDVHYRDFSIYGGYGYNWVFAHNWLLNASLSLGLSYNSSSNSVSTQHAFGLNNFAFQNFNVDGIGRLGIVWNNSKWFAGTNVIMHSYNYHKNQFSTNNTFGSLNIYFGFNFDRR